MSIPRRVRRRDRLYIIAEILLIAQTPALKTQIMYRASLSFLQLNEYLKLMTEQMGVLEIIPDEKGEAKAYKTTDRGLRYLKLYNELMGYHRKQPLGGVLVSHPEGG